jgi:hypothetical protein
MMKKLAGQQNRALGRFGRLGVNLFGTARANTDPVRRLREEMS